MRQIFFNQILETGTQVSAVDERYHHLVHVLGFASGDSLIAVGTDAARFHATVERVDKDQLVLQLGELLPALPAQPDVCLALAPPKGKALDQVLDIACQLGVRQIQPVITRRTVVRWTEAQWKTKSVRFEKILAQAAAQCNRPAPSQLLAPLDFELAHKTLHGSHVLAWEASDEKAEVVLDSLLEQKPEKICLWTGPEGGFDSEEVKQLLKSGAREISLGPALLRVPVAVAALLTRVQAAWERKNND